jgi:hypothetical protein
MIYKNISPLFLIALACSGCSFTDKNVEKTNDSVKKVYHHIDDETKHAVVAYGLTESNDVTDVYDVYDTDTNDEATAFQVKDYIADNNNCKIVYTSSPDGNKEDSEARTGTFEAYVHAGILFKIDCTGSDSNIDYKLNMKSEDGQKYKVVGNYSYYKETTK